MAVGIRRGNRTPIFPGRVQDFDLDHGAAPIEMQYDILVIQLDSSVDWLITYRDGKYVSTGIVDELHFPISSSHAAL